MKRELLLFAAFCMSFNALARQDTIQEKKSYNIISIDEAPPVIDGTINDPVWSSAEWQSDFTQHQPFSGNAPTYQTRFAIAHDADYIYVAIESFDPNPDSIINRMTRRDDLDGDYVFVDFDSYHDLRTCFAFAVNAGGAKGDFVISNNGSNDDETWDPIWWVKTSIGHNSWFAEMKIPFSQLRFDNSGDGVWGLNIGRSIYRVDEMSFWQHIPADSPGFIHLFGEMHGMKGVKPRKQMEIIPYFTSGIKKYKVEDDNPFYDGSDPMLNGGIDAKIGVTNNLTLDLSINPDFGQVEADPSEVNLSAYESFFEEKRPLFIEGKSIYDFSLGFGDGGSSQNLFYSRRIGRSPHYDPDLDDGEYSKQPEQTHIIAAAKLSGKTKSGTSIGILETVTAEEFATIDNNGDRTKLAVEPMTNYFVSRIVQDLNDGNTIVGGEITSTYRNITQEHLAFLPVSATTGGIDFQQYWNERGYSLKLVNYMSHVTGSSEAIADLQNSSSHLFQRPDTDYINYDTSRTSLSGFGGSLQFMKNNGRFNTLSAVIWKSPGLDVNDLGFFRMGDEITALQWFGYHWYEPFSIFRRLSIYGDYFRSWDFGGNLSMGGIEAGGYASFKNYWSGNINYNNHSTIRFNSMLRGGPAILVPGSTSLMLAIDTDSRKKLIMEPFIRFEIGKEDYENSIMAGLEIEYRPINSLNISIEPEFMKSFSMLQYVDHIEQGNEDRYIFASIDQTMLSMSIRANLTITPELTIQYWGQPFIATGNFYDYKHITEGLADDFSNRYYQYAEGEMTYLSEDESYLISEQGGSIDPYTISNNDFHVSEFLSNLVIRWEYRPGSLIYLVWSQSRDGDHENPDFRPGYDLPNIWNFEPTNVFLIKFSYRIGR